MPKPMIQPGSDEVENLISKLRRTLELLESGSSLRITGSPVRSILSLIGDLIALVSKTWKFPFREPPIPRDGDDLTENGQIKTRSLEDLFGIYLDPKNRRQAQVDKVYFAYHPFLGPILPPDYPEEDNSLRWLQNSQWDPVNEEWIMPLRPNRYGFQNTIDPIDVTIDLGRKLTYRKSRDVQIISDFIYDLSEILANLSTGYVDRKLVKAIHQALHPSKISSNAKAKKVDLLRYNQLSMKQALGIEKANSVRYYHIKRRQATGKHHNQRRKKKFSN